VNATGLDELASLRGEIEEITRGASHSFGIVSSAEEKIVAIVESINQTLTKLALVADFETTVDGFTAKTVITYSGSAASVWSTRTTAKLVDAHLVSLQRVYAFRAAVTAVVAAVGNAVVAISIAVGNPLTVWRAIKSAETLKSAVDRLAAVVVAQASTART
jgi:molybdopterin-binding protein